MKRILIKKNWKLAEFALIFIFEINLYCRVNILINLRKGGKILF